MKFAKELERDAVPEWRVKYLNYKAGKKHVKAVARAISRTNTTPRGLNNRTPSFFSTQQYRQSQNERAFFDTQYRDDSKATVSQPINSRPQPVPSSKLADDDRSTLQGSSMQYGSFVATPPAGANSIKRVDSKNNDFELPAPALHAPGSPELTRPADSVRKSQSRKGAERKTSTYGVPSSVSASSTLNSRHWQKSTAAKLDVDADGSSALKTIFSHSPGMKRDASGALSANQAIDLVRERESEFYAWMDSELDKVETFYQLKEEQAGQRLALLKEQLHEMRNRRLQEIATVHNADETTPLYGDSDSVAERSAGWVQPIKNKFFPPGPNSKAFQDMPRTPYLASGGQGNEERRDYIRRPENHDVSYRTAKRKLKLALQEFYRSLELLKSYALLNRTAFRKINKKFDKAANARPPLRYVNDKVNKAWFVNSDVLDGHIKAVEDLYARYFERGNRKLAAGKLRSLSKKRSDESGSSFLNGFLLGTGVVFTIQGLVFGSQLLFDDDHILRQRTSYLLQIYAGYFLMLLIFASFCINCWVWTKYKINYPFIFEFDQRSHIDWRRMAEFPSFFLLLLGVIMWINFSRFGEGSLYLYYPVILIGITALIILFPAPVLVHKSRTWFAYSHWRLLLAGIYPVEFRDFFLGDMYCSLTYSMANIELFFCLYARNWENPIKCNSNNSRALGFLTTLPAIWRLLQCIRRYRDTRNIFPHLVNGGKYTMTIISYVVLSIYRIHDSRTNLAIYITFSVINSIYTSIWDVFMDFSLVQFHSRNFFLRDILALKSRWPYYAILVVDPILRFSWIFYAIFTHNTQHSTIVSFLVALLEIIRRGVWALFRVENEHCANVSQYKASREVPLPYRIEPLMARSSAESSPEIQANQSPHATHGKQQSQQNQQQTQQEAHHLTAQPPSPEQNRTSAWRPGFSQSSSTAVASSLGTLRRRADTSSARTFSKILAEAHKQDFEKRRKTDDVAAEEHEADNSDEDDDDDEDEDAEDVRRAANLRHADGGDLA